MRTQLDQSRRLRHGERLSVSIGDDELDALQAFGNHIVDGISAGASDPDNCDLRSHLQDFRLGVHCDLSTESTRRSATMRNRSSKHTNQAVPTNIRESE